MFQSSAQVIALKKSSVVKMLKFQSALVAEWLLRMTHNRNVPGSILASDLSCMSYPSLPLLVSCLSLHHPLPKKGLKKNVEVSVKKCSGWKSNLHFPH